MPPPPSFTAQMGIDDSKFQYIVFGLDAEINPQHEPIYASKFIEALPEPPARHYIQVINAQMWDSVLLPWMPKPIKQSLDDRMPGHKEPPAHHVVNLFPKELLDGLPVVPPLPELRNLPLLSRDPKLERVLGRFTDIVSAIINSLSKIGQLVQTGPSQYSLVLRPTALELTPGSKPDTSPYYGILWVDNDGNLHYLAPDGTDTQLTGTEAETSEIDFLSGAGAPVEAQGEVGYHYFDFANGVLYKKE